MSKAIENARVAFRWALGLLLVMSAIPAMANVITSATVTLTNNCTGYSITICEKDLTQGVTYTVSYDFTVKGTAGSKEVTGSYTVPGTSGTPCQTQTGSLGEQFTGSVSVSGTATLSLNGTVKSTYPITLSSSSPSCPPPPPPCPMPSPCQASTIGSNFNGGQLPKGDFIWFNANFKPTSAVPAGTTISFTCSTITFTANGTTYTVTVPNAEITFSSSVSCTSTSFDSASNTWVTTVPASGNPDDIFLTGLAWPVPATLPGGINPVNWTGTFSATTSGLSVSWKWGAALYTCFPNNYNTANVKASHMLWCGGNNGDQAGTPEGAENCFIGGGARGGGGSNYTGSWSATGSPPEVCEEPTP